MPLSVTIKSELRKNLYQYEGKIDHLYLDTKGKVTIGVGHLIPNRVAIANIPLYKTQNKIATQAATLQEKQLEYDKIAKLPWGPRYSAASYKAHTSLVIKDTDINLLLDKHIDSFYKDLCHIFTKAHGYTDNFDNLHKNVQLALFDMIFNLGATRLVKSFPKFIAALKTGDWKKAATESHRVDVSPTRNNYVKQLFQTVPTKP